MRPKSAKRDASKRGSGSRGPLIVFMTIWSLIVLGFDSFIGYSLYRQWQAQSFLETQGVITRSEVISSRGSDSTTYRAEIAFTYEVDGVTYNSETYRFGQMGSSDRAMARRAVRQFPRGETVTVYHDPNDPHTAVLVTGLEGFDLFILIFLLPFNAVMVGGWVAGLSPLLSRRDRDTPAIRTSLNRVNTLHLPRINSLYIGLGIAGLGGFISIFIIAFLVGMTNAQLMAGWLQILAVLAVGGTVVHFLHNIVRPRRVLVDHRAETITATSPSCAPIPFRRIIDIDVHETRLARQSQESEPRYAHQPMITYLRDDEQEQTFKLPVSATSAHAEACVSWLREQVGLTPIDFDARSAAREEQEGNVQVVAQAVAGADQPVATLERPVTGDAIRNVPAGCSVSDGGREIVLQASTRQVLPAIPLIFFALFWNGIVSVFLGVLAISAWALLFGHEPSITDSSTGEPMAAAALIFMGLFLIPFVLIGLTLLGSVIMLLFGNIRITLRGSDGRIASGVGPLRWTKRFDTGKVTSISLRNSSYRVNNQKLTLIHIEADRTVRFGTMLSDDRRKWLGIVLADLLVPSTSTPAPAIPATPE